MKPADLKYSETHEWVRVTGKVAAIGITDHAVSQLSDLVHLELPKVGDVVEQGSSFGEIESVKTVAELISPISGKIAEVHKELIDDLETLVDDPFGDGWLIKVKLEDPAELESLMSAKDYNAFIKASEEREGEEEDNDIDEGDFV